MATQDYVLNGSTSFTFPFAVRSASLLTVELVPGGVVSTGDYTVIGAGPTATGVTVRYPNAPTSDTVILRITRYVQPDRVTTLNGPSDITVANLNAEFDNAYQAIEDFQVSGVNLLQAVEDAEAAADAAADAAAEAEAAAAGVNLPSITGGDALKLLRVNAAGTAYEFGQTAAEIALLAARTAAITYTVGPTGDYASLNAALEDVTKKFPSHASTAVRVTLSLQAAFVMAEQVIVDGLNLGWITITAGTAVTVTRSALTTETYSGIYAVFAARNNAVLPVFDAVFSVDTTGTATGRTGLSVTGGSRAVVTSGSGFTNAPKYNLHVVEAGQVTAAGATFASPSTAAEYNVYLRDAATANLGAATLSGGTTGSVALFDAARAELASSDVSGTGGTGVSANRGCSANCYAVTSAGRTTSFSVSAGSTIAAGLSGGTLSQTANTITANGIIFQ